MKLRSIMTLFGCTLLAACALRAPKIESVQLRREAPLSIDDFQAGDWPAADWWRRYQDPTLDALIAGALQGAPTLQTADARFAVARQSAQITGAVEGVQMDANAAMQRQRLSDNGLFPPQLLGFNWYNQADIGITASYTFDWWGKQRASIAAAIDEAHASQAESSAAALVLASEIADHYFGWQMDQARMALAQQRLSILERHAAITALRVKADIEAADTAQTNAQNLAATRSDVAMLQGSTRLHVMALAALLGRAPNELPTLTPRTLPDIPTGLPANARIDLIARRPDIAASRWRVEAAKQNLVVARADYFPDMTVHALAGLSSIDLSNLLQYGSRVPTLGVAIHLPLFDSGLRSARFGARQAALQSAIASYNEAIIGAAREVAVAASNTLQISAQRRERETQLAASTALQKTAAARVSAGITDIRPQLLAELALVVERDALTQLKLAALSADIALQRALGGGYEFKAEAHEHN